MSAAADEPLDPAIAAALYEEWSEELRAFLWGILRNRDDAAEALQITFSKFVSHGASVREESRKGWLFQVAYREAISIRRGQNRSSRAHTELANRHASRAVSPAPEEALLKAEQAKLIRERIAQLSTEQQQIVRLRVFEEKTFATIAQELGLPLGTVLTRMRLALQHLQQRIDR